MKRLSTREAADELGLSDRTLEKWRTENRGPQYIRLGSRIVYDRESLNEWVGQQIVDPAKRNRLADLRARIRVRLLSEKAT